jgi:hypothetical protein
MLQMSANVLATQINGEVYDITVFAQSSASFMLMSGAQEVQAVAIGLPSG